MPNDLKGLAAESVRKIENIVGQSVEAIGVDALRFAAEVIAALVRRDDAEAGLRERFDELAPAKPEFRKAVQEKQ